MDFYHHKKRLHFVHEEGALEFARILPLVAEVRVRIPNSLLSEILQKLAAKLRKKQRHWFALGLQAGRFRDHSVVLRLEIHPRACEGASPIRLLLAVS